MQYFYFRTDKVKGDNFLYWIVAHKPGRTENSHLNPIGYNLNGHFIMTMCLPKGGGGGHYRNQG